MCQGCHEPRPGAPSVPKELPAALRRGPSRLKPDPEGSWPLSFPRLVRPALSRNPIVAGKGDGKDWTVAYWRLSQRTWAPFGTRSQPGGVGAARSRLFEMFRRGHHDVKLTDEQWRRLTVWMDCGSPFHGAYERIEEQAQGKLVLPAIE